MNLAKKNYNFLYLKFLLNNFLYLNFNSKINTKKDYASFKVSYLNFLITKIFNIQTYVVVSNHYQEFTKMFIFKNKWFITPFIHNKLLSNIFETNLTLSQNFFKFYFILINFNFMLIKVLNNLIRLLLINLNNKFISSFYNN